MDLETLKKYLKALGVDFSSYSDDMLVNLLKIKLVELEGIIGCPITPVLKEELHHKVDISNVLVNNYPFNKDYLKIILDGEEITPVKVSYNSGIIYFKENVKGDFLEVTYCFGIGDEADELVSLFIADYILNKKEGTEGSIGYQRVKSKTDGNVSITYDYADTNSTNSEYKTYIDKWIDKLQKKYNHGRVSII